MVSLVEPSAGGAIREVTEVLAAAERDVVGARQRHAAGEADALDDLAEIWARVTSPAHKKQLAALVATV